MGCTIHDETSHVMFMLAGCQHMHVQAIHCSHSVTEDAMYTRNPNPKTTWEASLCMLQTHQRCRDKVCRMSIACI